MNTDCMEYRELLRERFDAGMPVDDGAPDHADRCPECAAYRHNLVAMEDAFAALPLEAPRNVLVQRVKARIAAAPAHANELRWWLPAAALLACALSAGAIWYFAVPVDPWTWWDYANQAAAASDWAQGVESFEADLAAVQEYWDSFSAPFASYPATLLWGVAICVIVLLAALNGTEAYRLRTVSARPRQRR